MNNNSVLQEVLLLAEKQNISKQQLGKMGNIPSSSFTNWIKHGKSQNGESIVKLSFLRDKLKGETVIPSKASSFIVTVNFPKIILDIYKENVLTSLKITGITINKEMVRKQGCRIVVEKRNDKYIEKSGTAWSSEWLSHIFEFGSEKAQLATKLADIESTILDLVKEKAEIEKKLFG